MKLRPHWQNLNTMESGKTYHTSDTRSDQDSLSSPGDSCKRDIWSKKFYLNWKKNLSSNKNKNTWKYVDQMLIGWKVSQKREEITAAFTRRERSMGKHQRSENRAGAQMVAAVDTFHTWFHFCCLFVHLLSLTWQDEWPSTAQWE